MDVNELAARLNSGFSERSVGIKRTIQIEPLEKAKKILIFGSERNRRAVKNLIAEWDLPSEKHIVKKFDLKYADPDKVKEYLEELFKKGDTSSRYYYYRNSRDDEDVVRVISNPILKQVTVITVPENMVKVEEQIKEWDKPLDLKDVMPLIITLRNSDPVKMQKLLSTLFTDSSSNDSGRFWSYYYDNSSNNKEKIVGALFGQLTFEAVPDTKKLIVISKIPEAYEVIKELIADLDSADKAELPMVIILKYADAEELCDQLNALLNERGTTATIRRSRRGLSPSTMSSQNTDSFNQNNSNNDNNKNNNNNPDLITPWWTTGEQDIDATPTSNLIGKIRFIPVHRSKAILVLAPPEYEQSIKDIIEELDQPGDQVLIRAVILQVDRRHLQSLGMKISTDPLAFGNIGENMVTALTQISSVKSMGGSNDSLKTTVSFVGDINVMLDILQKEANAEILNQPSLWTMDNEEAVFIRGDLIAIKENDRVTDQNTTQSFFKYRDVGVTLRVRPNITPDNSVNLTLSLEISTVKPELVNGNVAIEQMKTSTHMNAKDGETLMLGGILYQANNLIETKVPILSAIPLLGRLFTHKRREQSNKELLIFITPYIFRHDDQTRKNPGINKSFELLEDTEKNMGKNEKDLRKRFE